jgi:tight adherence protein B
MAGYVVAGLPFFLMGGMLMFNPYYFMPMINTDLGNYALAGAFCMQVAGFLVMRKIINIKM